MNKILVMIQDNVISATCETSVHGGMIFVVFLVDVMSCLGIIRSVVCVLM
jgi:hypothetical protein